MLTVSLLFLLGLIAVNSESLTYPNQITDFYYEASDEDKGEGPYAFLDDTCKLEQSDGDTSTGCQIKSSDTPQQYTWGLGPGERAQLGIDSTVGMVGTFSAIDINPGINPSTGNPYTYYTITSISISFTGGCLNDMDIITQDSTVYYTKGGTTIINTDYDLVAKKQSGVTTYSLDIKNNDAGIQLFSGENIGFNIQTNSYCEAGMEVVEFTIEGEPAETAEPTKSPSNSPTQPPTTGEPTMAPTSQCKGEVTWGDPHFRLMAFDNDAVSQFNYQELGWFFYIAPCDLAQFEYFPFFLLSYHTRCYWRGNPKGCINNNMLILNTKPDPIVITFDYKNLEIDIPNTLSMYEVSSNALKGNGEINTNGNYKDKDGKRLEITYNDGGDINGTPKQPNQSGKFVLFYDGDTIVIQLYDIQYDGLPRRCNKNTLRGEDLECGPNQCEDLVIDIRNRGSWTYFTCPSCLRNIACGLMGKYYRGDCTQNQLNDPNDLCSQILVRSDGTIETDSNGRANGDDTFARMADTWAYDYVKDRLSNIVSYTINFAKEKNTIFKHEKKFLKPRTDGRSLDILDASFYDGKCNNNMTHIKIVNETCRQETVVKYAKCCKEIGICKILWKGCIEDYCSCTEPATIDNDKPANITDEWCINSIIRDSMNTTCSVDALWPTSTPTSAPTPSPTGLVAGLPQGQKAQDLIWLYLIFVVLFIIIAGVAYWYYRKKNNSGKASFQDDVDSGVPNTSVGY